MIEGLEAREARFRDIIKKLTIMSDTFMRNVFKEKECTEYLLRVIMDDPDIEVIEQTLQKDYKNLHGRSAILDCVARDSGGRVFNVEIQQDHEGATPKRARYYSGLLDMNILKSGEDFEKLPETYVIFITRKDVIGEGRPIYHISRSIEDTGTYFGDGARIIYADASRRDDTELGRLMQDLNCQDSADMYSSVLARRVYELKETEKGVEDMCEELRELYNEGMEEGKVQGKAETAVSLSERGMNIIDIADILKVSREQVENWLDKGVSLAK